MIIIPILLIIFSMIISSVVTAFIIKHKSRRYESNLLLSIYQKQAEDLSELRKFRHDYKNQLAGLQVLLESGEYERAIAYLSETNDKFTTACQKVKTYSDNTLIDAILQNIACKCAKSNIDFDAFVFIQDKLPLTDVQICTLISNVADNAYEAASLQQSTTCNSKKAFISFTSSVRTKWLIITVENSYDGVLNIGSDGKILTRKENNAKSHGIGLKSVASIIENVDGAQLKMDPDTENKIFRLSLIFPL